MGWSSFQALAWQAAPMPYSTGPVSIARLPSGNDDFLAFVRFPAGWSRSQPVVYEAAEEFVILEGELRIDDQCWVAPAYGCVAPGSVRRLTASQPGCLAWARFHGSPRAVKAERAVQTADTARAGANRLRPAGALRASAPASWSESPRRLLHAFPASETWFEPAFRLGHDREAGRHDAIDLDTLAWWSSASDLPSRPPTPSDTPSRSAIVHRISEMQR
jgi:hypothetical protein